MDSEAVSREGDAVDGLGAAVSRNSRRAGPAPAAARRLASRVRPTGWVGIGMTLPCLVVGLFGRYFAPYSPTGFVGVPFQGPSGAYPLGLDYLGRDALTRFLWGGRTALLMAFSATVLGLVIGATGGLLAAYERGALDAAFNRVTEVLMAFPSLILVLLFVSAVGTGVWVVIVAVAITHAPRIGRIARGAALEIRERAFVEVAQARGESRWYIVSREMLPNIATPLAVDFGMRFAGSIVLVAGLSFLGFGLQPPTADWGLIISENRSALLVQPLALVAPVVAIAMLTIGISLMVDGIGPEGSGWRPRRGAPKTLVLESAP